MLTEHGFGKAAIVYAVQVMQHSRDMHMFGNRHAAEHMQVLHSHKLPPVEELGKHILYGDAH